MVFISKEHEVIRSTSDLNSAVDLYFDWFSTKDFYTTFTSGSTGKPKNIEIPKEAIRSSIQSTKKYFNLNSADLFICNLNTEYIGGKMMVLRAAEIGADLLILPAATNPLENLGRTATFISSNWGKNFFSFVPMQLQSILQKEEYIQLLRTAKAILVGGSSVSEETRELIRHYQLPVYETYGMTETVSHIAVKDLRTTEQSFTLLPEVKIRTNSEKCLEICAPSTLNNWITTNDLAEITGNNTFILKGRIDQVVNSGGIKIQLEEIDTLIGQQFPGLDNYFCYGLPDKVLGSKLVLFIENTDHDIDLTKLNAPKYHIPKEVHYLDKFEKTPSGKIDKISTVEKIKK